MNSNTTGFGFHIPSFINLVGTLSQASGGFPAESQARANDAVEPAAPAPADKVEGVDKVDTVELPDDVPNMPPNPSVRHWGQATLQIRDLHNDLFGFTLRSKVNAPLLSGGPLPASGDLMTAAKRLLDLCCLDANFRIAQVGHLYELCLLDNQAQIVGRSVKIATEPVAIAMVKLVTVQAQRARIALRAE